MSHAEGVNIKRRRVLIASTAVIGAAGVGAIATPFVRSWYPSAKAEAAGAAVVQPDRRGRRALLRRAVVLAFYDGRLCLRGGVHGH